MNLNLTLFGEMLTFAVLIWVTTKYIWPPIIKAIEERQQKITDGLDAAKRGQTILETAHQDVLKQIQEAKVKTKAMIDQANQHANTIIEESKSKADQECKKILVRSKENIAQEIKKAQIELNKQNVELIVSVSEKILQQKIDTKNQEQLINQLIDEIQS